MKTWTDDIDPCTIPDSVLKSERARRNAGRRKRKAGRFSAPAPQVSNELMGAFATLLKPKRSTAELQPHELTYEPME